MMKRMFFAFAIMCFQLFSSALGSVGPPHRLDATVWYRKPKNRIFIKKNVILSLRVFVANNGYCVSQVLHLVRITRLKRKSRDTLRKTWDRENMSDNRKDMHSGYSEE